MAFRDAQLRSKLISWRTLYVTNSPQAVKKGLLRTWTSDFVVWTEKTTKTTASDFVQLPRISPGFSTRGPRSFLGIFK